MKTTFPCDICGADNPVRISVAEKYTDGQPLHACGNCGFVYVRERRDAKEIARSWSEEIFQKGYTAKIPYVFARQTYVAEFLDENVGLKNKALCDIGAGEGQFLEICKNKEDNLECFGIEPSSHNCGLLEKLSIPYFKGTIEEYTSKSGNDKKFDIISIMWTLENCLDCNKMISSAYEMLNPDGYVVVATGSRILVPFKKLLSQYLSKNPSDTHSFRFSANSISNLLTKHDFDDIKLNQYQDGDFLVAIGQKSSIQKPLKIQADNPNKILEFFQRWDTETEWLNNVCEK